MQRNMLILLFLSWLATSTLMAIEFPNIVKANPFPTNPVITIVTPSQQTYNTSSLTLKIKITTQYDGFYFNSSERRITYSLDKKDYVSIEQLSYSYNQETKSSIVEASIELTELNKGIHTLTVHVEYDYETKIIDADSTINFSINLSNSFPRLELTSIIVIILVITIFFIYSKKRGKK